MGIGNRLVRGLSIEGKISLTDSGIYFVKPRGMSGWAHAKLGYYQVPVSAITLIADKI